VLLWVFVERVSIGRDVAALLVVVANVPIGFAMSRLLLARRGGLPGAGAR
jgi:hypothetical protein